MRWNNAIIACVCASACTVSMPSTPSGGDDDGTGSDTAPPDMGSDSVSISADAWDAAFGGKNKTERKSLCNTLAWTKNELADDPACSSLIAHAPTAAYHDEWGVHDWGMALASMYEATGDPHYLDELGDLNDILVAGRGARDDVRGRFYEGWVIDRGCAWGSLDVTGLFAGMLARYARIAAEHPELGPDVQARAARYAASAATALGDIPADERGGTIGLLYLVTPGADPACTAQITSPGMPYPYNMDHLVGGALLDLEAAGIPSIDLPRLWTQWTTDAMRVTPTGHLAFSRWPTGLAPDGKDRIDDAAHAAITAAFVARMATDGWVGALPLALDAGETLVDLTTAQATDGAWEFPGGMDGSPNDKVWDRAQVSCSGWAMLAGVAPEVFARCAAVTLQVVDGAQPNITAANYATLLVTRP